MAVLMTDILESETWTRKVQEYVGLFSNSDVAWLGASDRTRYEGS